MIRGPHGANTGNLNREGNQGPGKQAGGFQSDIQTAPPTNPLPSVSWTRSNIYSVFIKYCAFFP